MNDTAIIIVDHGSRRSESNALLERITQLFADRYGEKFSIVEPAHMELAEPSIEAAYDKCVARGARHVVVLPFFLAPGKHWTTDIPGLAACAAYKYPNVTHRVAAPLGIDDLILELLHKRVTESLSLAEVSRA